MTEASLGVTPGFTPSTCDFPLIRYYHRDGSMIMHLTYVEATKQPWIYRDRVT